MLEKQINRTQQSNFFDTYKEAKLFKIKYGGTVAFIKQYEERGE